MLLCIRQSAVCLVPSRVPIHLPSTHLISVHTHTTWTSRAGAGASSYRGPEGTCQLLFLTAVTQKENKKNTVAKSTFYFMKVPFTLSHLTLMTMQHSIVTPFTDEGMKLKESKHRQEVPSRYVQLFALLGCLSGAGWGFLLQASFPSSFPWGWGGNF